MNTISVNFILKQDIIFMINYLQIKLQICIKTFDLSFLEFNISSNNN